MRKVVYISGTRADFGLMRSTLLQAAARPDLEVSVIATGMHLSPAYGDTVHEIEAAGLPIIARVPVPLEPATGATMARNIGTMLGAFTEALEQARSDVVLLLGDRGEMLAGALAAVHLNIPVAHIHGGERSGTVDEPVRHAISKLSHIHLTATAEARERLIRMGENADHIHVVGAPGLDDLIHTEVASRADIATRYGFDPDKPFALMVFHPVLQEAGSAATDARAILQTLSGAGVQVLALMPNADAGSGAVREALEAADGSPGVAVVTHLARPDFIAAMATADVMIGNSSAGIIEAASFGTPVINVGSRQTLRERNANVREVSADPAALASALSEALKTGRGGTDNVYGDGQTGQRIAELLATKQIGDDLLKKINAY